MELKQKQQLEHYLKEFVKLSNDFDKEGKRELSQYWKGQFFGIIKVINLLGLDINTAYYLSQLN